MEPLWKLVYLLEPSAVTLIITAIVVSYASASRALKYGKEMERNHDLAEASIILMERNHDLAEASITLELDRFQVLMMLITSSCSLLLMFYLFSSVSQFLTVFTAVASVFALYFCASPYIAEVKSQFGLSSNSFTRLKSLVLFLCIGLVLAWLVSGYWVLNNLLGVSLCIAYVSHVRPPNIKICAMLLVGLFVYDIFWVFFSERFFGANVMVSVATQQAHNPVRTVAKGLSLPGLELIAKELELPGKIVFPENMLGGAVPGSTISDYMMLGVGDMVFPSMLLALVLRFDHRKGRDSSTASDVKSSKGFKYFWYALFGYAIGLISAFAAGILTSSPQPALLYLVPSTLGPVVVLSWMKRDLAELWEGTATNIKEKTHTSEVEVSKSVGPAPPAPARTGVGLQRATPTLAWPGPVRGFREPCPGLMFFGPHILGPDRAQLKYNFYTLTVRAGPARIGPHIPWTGHGPPLPRPGPGPAHPFLSAGLGFTPQGLARPALSPPLIRSVIYC